MEKIIEILFIGVFATATIDIFALFLKHGLKQATTNWGMVGRWFAGMPRGTFIHRPIGKSPPVNHESAIGWSMHYIIGVVYAGIYLAIVEASTLTQPGLLSAIAFGLATVLAPWLTMQPGLGMGVFARKAPDPWKKRITSLVVHSIFGAALFVSWLIYHRVLTLSN